MSAAPPSIPYSPGLEGVVAGETAVSTVEDGLRYRGYPVGELVEHCTFDDVAYLLLYNELPTAAQLKGFQERVAAARSLPASVPALYAALPKTAAPLDVLRTTVSILASYDPDVSDNSLEANRRKTERLIGQMPVAIAAFARISNGQQPIAAKPGLSHCANFLWMLKGKEPTADDVKALDVSLILYAEHEFNASTFTARVIVSTMSDLHSAIVGAIGALKGPLHGGANEKVMGILESAGSPANAEKWTLDALARKERIMGFGHRVYKSGDVRAGIIKPYVQKASAATGNTKWEETAEIIEQTMAREKKMYPNVDWPVGRLYHAMDLPIPIYTPMFAMSRVAGWSAHVMEQLGNNRLIRPRSLYNGVVARSVPPRAQRG